MPEAPLSRWDVVDLLRREAGARSLLLVRTPSTSADLIEQDEIQRFDSVTDLVYVHDHQRPAVDGGASLPSLEQLATMVGVVRPSADIVFADPWHAYDESVRTFELALGMLEPGGWLVTHDCLPRDPDTVPVDQADLRWQGAWCGETWRGFVDVVHRLPAGSRAWLVDADHGIGVVRPSGPLGPPRPSRVPGLDPLAAWEWFVVHLDDLVEIVGADDWDGRLSTADPHG